MRRLMRFKLKFTQCFRYYSQKHATKLNNDVVPQIRNIGILAHIDAGKTTTTERMLFYAGTIRSMGEVHHGNTVTDFMDEERLRGITIASVTVTFPWNNFCFNLVDTPGHIDFTMEVEQSLSVIDGAIVVLDSSAGVEAQTVTVWNQAERYSLPRIIYCNKMDRKDGSLQLCLDTLESKLRIRPFAIQLPVYNSNHDLIGLVDLLTMERTIWNSADQGRTFTTERLTEDDEKIWDEAMKSRQLLVDGLSDLDNHLAELVITEESLDKVDASVLTASLRRVTLARTGIPVLCGSSYKNLGVQPLMDAVVKFLPAPNERVDQLARYFENNLCARAFKVIHDDQKRLLTFFRVYSGSMVKGQKIYNITQQKSEQTVKIMIPYAEEHDEVSQVFAGNITVLSGLKHTMSGDLVTTNLTAANKARKLLSEHRQTPSNDEEDNDTFGFAAKVPVPVFWCSIEPPTQALQTQLEQALVELQREDPSLQVTQNAETGQTVLAGMGELHLEIIKNRIISEYKIEVELGPLQIAYKEALQGKVKDSIELSHRIGSTKHSVKVTLSVWDNEGKANEKEVLLMDRHPDSAANLAAIHPKNLQAIKNGIDMALAHGPKLNCPMTDVSVMLHWFEVGRGTSETIVSSAVSQCLRKMFSSVGTSLREPIMHLEVATTSDKLSIVLADVARRRAAIQNISNRGDTKILSAMAPLAELLGYSTDLRTITSGMASFTMEFQEYQVMGKQEEAKVIKEVTGFYPK